MKRPWRTVLVWSIALAAGGAWWALHGRSAVVAAEEASVPVFTASDAIPVDSIDRIDLTRAGAPPMVFRRTGGQWSQTEPFVADLDAWSARQLIVELAGLAASPWVGEAADRSAFGLEPPVASVILHAGDRTWSHTLHSRLFPFRFGSCRLGQRQIERWNESWLSSDSRAILPASYNPAKRAPDIPRTRRSGSCSRWTSHGTTHGNRIRFHPYPCEHSDTFHHWWAQTFREPSHIHADQATAHTILDQRGLCIPIHAVHRIHGR